MSSEEFSREFDILYNGIASNDAPPLDLYEKSIYLTKAQLELVKNYFNPRGNKYGRGFESSSKRRDDLKELIRNYKSTINLGLSDGISKDSQFIRIPSNVFMIIQEKAKVISSNNCINDTYIKVKPVTHDEYNSQENNPFKKPGDSVIWRIDYYSASSGIKNVELISPHTISEYHFRYIIYPSPIVLTDLLTAFPNETLTIDGVSQKQTCKLSENIHREILDRAVELATVDYKPERLQAKVQLNQRNE